MHNLDLVLLILAALVFGIETVRSRSFLAAGLFLWVLVPLTAQIF